MTYQYASLLMIMGAASATGEVELEPIIREIWPYIGASVLVLFLAVYFPPIIYFIPRLLGLA